MLLMLFNGSASHGHRIPFLFRVEMERARSERGVFPIPCHTLSAESDEISTEC